MNVPKLRLSLESLQILLPFEADGVDGAGMAPRPSQTSVCTSNVSSCVVTPDGCRTSYLP